MKSKLLSSSSAVKSNNDEDNVLEAGAAVEILEKKWNQSLLKIFRSGKDKG